MDELQRCLKHEGGLLGVSGIGFDAFGPHMVAQKKWGLMCAIHKIPCCIELWMDEQPMVHCWCWLSNNKNYLSKGKQGILNLQTLLTLAGTFTSWEGQVEVGGTNSIFVLHILTVYKYILPDASAAHSATVVLKVGDKQTGHK